MLSRLTGRDDIVFGVTVSGRPPEIPGVERMVGLLINTVPVRVDMRGEATVAEVLRGLQEEQSRLAAHQHLGLTDIARIAGDRDLFDTLFVFQNTPATATTADGGPGPALRVGAVTGHSATHFPLLLAVAPGEAMTMRLDHRSDLVGADTAHRAVAMLLGALADIAHHPDRVMNSLDVFDPDERQRQLTEWTGAHTDVPARPLPALFEEQVRRSPDAFAVGDATARWTYAQLDARANRIARVLLAHGAGPGRLVIVALPKSPETVATLLAVLKTGASYLPLDPAELVARTTHIAERAAPDLVVATTGTHSAVGVPGVRRCLVDDPDTRAAVAAADSHDVTDTERGRAILPQDAAYVIGTSGSTGAPKCVVVEHSALTDYLAWAGDAYPEVTGRVLVPTALSFDLTVTGLYPALVNGGEIWLTDLRDAVVDPRHAPPERPALLKLTPSHLPLLLEAPDTCVPTGRLLVGGEALTGAALAAFRERYPDVTVINTYGPSEATVNCSQFVIEPGTDLPDGPVPIGRPMHNTRLYVLDSRLRPVPVGAPGELYIAGAGLARGYRHDPAATDSRFVPDPFGPPGSRMYRSGDLAQWRADGNLEFLGRRDHQVKVRGHRVELGEIEAVLVAHPEVDAAAVVLTGSGDGQGLIAYVAGAGAGGANGPRADELRRHLMSSLPSYMRPDLCVTLPALPLTRHGKVDRAALPDPADSAPAQARRRPRTPREETLCALFAEVLQCPVDIDDDFFERGGHSLSALRLVGRIRATLGVKLAVRSLFEHHTVAGLAAHIAQGAPEGNALAPVLALRQGGSRPPLFCLPAATGLSWCYAGLLRHIGPDRPVYGLQSRRFTAADHELRDVGELADAYLADIRSLQPQGPYQLLGWSFGGVVAQAVATRLRAAGETVHLLALLDSYAARLSVDASETDRWERARQLTGVMLGGEGAQPGFDADTVEPAVRSVVEAETLADVHVPDRFDGPVVFFSAAHSDPRLPPARETWVPYLTGPVHHVPLEARHLEMTSPEALARVGGEIKDRLL
ncbi:amino acid adenylation domain-containing protein [Streptomyces sp. DHE7-1]|nr:amino acid adenylation domain-containing protein [Streptomyces sp. DHE7-1]